MKKKKKKVNQTSVLRNLLPGFPFQKSVCLLSYNKNTS